MQKKLSKICLLLLCVVFVGCHREDSRLQSADAIMEEHPDSAFNILKEIDKNALSKDDLPYYALLYTQAQIKNNIRVMSDSLIKIPIEYYTNNDSRNLWLRTNFYAGFILCNNNSHPEALKKLLRVYDTAKRNNDFLWIARSAELIGDIFYNTYTSEQSILFSKETIRNYKKIGKIDSERFAIADLATRYAFSNKADQAILLLDSILEVTQKDMPDDHQLINYIKSAVRTTNIKLKRADKITSDDYAALENYDGELNKISNVIEKSWIENGNNACSIETEALLFKLRQNTTNNEARLHLTYALYKRAKAKGDYKYATSLTDTIIMMQSALADSLLKESIRGVESDFYSQKAEEEHEVSIRKNHIIIGISVTAIVIVALILALFYSKLRSKKKEIESNLSMLTTMREHSMRVESENQSLVREAGKRQEEHSRIVSDLFATKWKSMNSLCDQYIALNGDNKCERMFYKNFESILNDMRTPGGLKDVEGMVNKYMDGVAMRFRDEMPGLKEYDYQLLFLTAAGFSAKTIALLLNINSQNYYLRRRRLRSRIEAEAPPHIDEFLQRLGS